MISRLTQIRAKTTVEKNEEETIDMCMAIDQITRRARREGKKEGLEKGRMKGRAEGMQAGKKELIVKMWQNGVAMDFIAKIAEQPLSQIKAMLEGM